MFKPRLYVAYLVAPVVILLPLAIGFVRRVTALSAHSTTAITIGAVAGYLVGIAAFAWFALRYAGAVERAVIARSDASVAVSECLRATSTAAALLWVGWGTLLALAGAVATDFTLIRVQYFVEAALLIAAPAMAWTYWGGKSFLLRRAGGRRLRYVGRVYTIAVKLAIVFIGLFAVAVGALVHLTSSYLARRLSTGGLSPEAIVREVLWFGIFIGTITAVLFAWATVVLARDITIPLRELLRVSTEMAGGRFDTEPRIFSDDEVGSLVAQFTVSHQNIRSLLGRMQSSGSAITAGVRTMSEGRESLVRTAREQSDITSASTNALTRVRNESRSVLNAVEKFSDVTVDSASRAHELQVSSDEVARRMEELFHSVEKTSSGTSEISATSGETSMRTNELSGFTAEALSFVAEMDATIEQIHRTSEATAELSRAVEESAEHGRKAVGETVEGIRTAQESTRRTAGAFEALQHGLGQIDQIVLMIEELTNRTNLLSFNAAIIAAQAGQNDFGFSVIADEVRQLAERTRGATKEIGAIVRGVQPVAAEAQRAIGEGVSRVDSTVILAQRAEESLTSILRSSANSLDMARSISKALEEQTRAMRHLHEVVARMSNSVAEIHRATEGQTEATRLLAAEAERVRDIALQVKRASDEQRKASGGIAGAMEQIASEVRTIRDRLDAQLVQADEVAAASRETLVIAQKNAAIADEFSAAIQALLQSGSSFEREVARFKV